MLIRAWERFHARTDDEAGAIAAEYVILLTLIAVGLVTSLTLLGLAISTNYQTVGDCIAALPGTC
jgi:Flp pilus assembly pilin Flp